MAKNTVKQDEKFTITGKRELIRRLLTYMVPYRNEVIVVLTLMVLVMVVGLINPYFTRQAIDEYIRNSDMKGLAVVAIIMAALNILAMAASRARIYKMGIVSNRIVLSMREDLYAHIQKLSFSFFDSRPVGKILARVVGDVNALQTLFSNSVTSFLPHILQLIMVTVMMFILNYRLALATMAVMPLLGYAMFMIEAKARPKWQEFRSKRSNLNAFTHESFAGVRVIQGFATEDDSRKTHDSMVTEMMKSFMSAIFLNDFFWPLVESSWGIGSCVVYFVGVNLVFAGDITLGTLIAFTMYVSMFWRPVMNISNFYNTLITNFASAERIFEILDIDPDIESSEKAIEMDRIAGVVEFSNVDFSYEDGVPVLTDVSFSVQAGESIALVGETGAGKTTIVNLLSRFYDTDRGEVLIDGTDIRKVTLESLRSQMGIMLQDTFLFAATIRENIRYGKLDATDDEIERAARAVNAHDFIMKLENGYETEIRERGSRLSVGQRQLISFARALLADPRILILDEATSNIDTQTERLVQDGIKKLLKNRTSFVIAHRLSTIRDCDRIIVINGGVIAESGTHEELLAKKGDYYSLYMSQYRFLSEGA